MTATKYTNIQREAYFRGRAEEQQKAEQIIYEKYIPKQKIKDKIEELKIKSQQTYEEFLKSNRLDMNLHCRGIYTDAQIVILKELLEEKKQ